MALVKLSTFRELSRLYSDERPGGENAFISDDDVNKLVNLQLRETYDLLVQARGQEFFETKGTLTTTANSADVSLPATFYQLLSLYVQWSATDLEPIEALESIDDRADFASHIPWGRDVMKTFRIRGAGIELFPTPTAETTLQIRYVPRFEDLVADDDEFDTVNGGERMIAYRVAADMLTIGKNSNVNVMQLYAAERERIERIAEDRAAAHPARIRDVRYGEQRRRTAWRRWGTFG